MLLGKRIRQAHAYVYGAITHYGAAFQRTSTSHALSYCPHRRQTAENTLPQPHNRNPCRVSHDHGLASSDFARHYSRNHYCFLFLRVLRCFTSPRSPLTPYFIQMQVTAHNCGWVPPFGHPRINARLPTPQGLSQAPTSFIGSRCQGIHHAPCPACPHKHPTPHNNTIHNRTDSHCKHGTLTRHTPDTTQNRPPAQSRRRSDQQHPQVLNKQNSQKTHSKHYTPTTTITHEHADGDARVHYPEIKQPRNQPAPSPSPGPAGLMSQGPTVCSQTQPIIRDPKAHQLSQPED